MPLDRVKLVQTTPQDTGQLPQTQGSRVSSKDGGSRGRGNVSPSVGDSTGFHIFYTVKYSARLLYYPSPHYYEVWLKSPRKRLKSIWTSIPVNRGTCPLTFWAWVITEKYPTRFYRRKLSAPFSSFLSFYATVFDSPHLKKNRGPCKSTSLRGQKLNLIYISYTSDLLCSVSSSQTQPQKVQHTKVLT